MDIKRKLFNRDSITFLTIMLGVVMTSGLVIALPQYIKQMAERRAIEEQSRAKQQLDHRISDVLAERIDGLWLLADLYADGIIKKQADHEYYAQKLILRAPGLQSVLYYDRRLMVKYSYPASEQSAADSLPSPDVDRLAKQAAQTRTVVISHPVPGPDHQRIIVLVPIRASDRFLGLIAGALTMETIAQSVISPLLDVNLPFQLRDQRGALLWGRNQERLAGVETTTLPVTIGSNRWSLHIPATAIMGYSQIRLYDWLAIPFDWLTLVIGGAIIMVVTLGTSLLNRQGRLLEDKNQQIAQLNQAIQTHADQLEEEVARRTAELRKREQELRESYEQLKQAQAQLLQHERLSTIGRMSAVIAHELRNPLAALCTAAEELTHAVQLSGDHQILLDIISSQSLRLNQIINDTLSFTKPVLLEKTPTDVHQTIDRVIASLESEGRSRTRVTISKRYDASVPPLLTDQYRMEQVLWNILLNAVQSLPESRGTVQVGTTWHASGIDGVTSPCVEISVTDSGSGIPADHLDRIFEPFHTTKSRGTGLGLAIARRIVEAHGGRIRVDTEVNRGTTISVLLPSVTPEDADVHRAPLRF